MAIWENSLLSTFNFDMDILTKKTLYFLLPLVIIIFFPFLIFYTSGEFISTDKILAMELSGKPMLLGKILPFWGGDHYSKIEIIKFKKPAVITLGNSRVLSIREKFFKNNNFYNGGGIGNLVGFKKAIEQLGEEEKPKIIILGLEQSYFSPFSDSHEIPDLALENKQNDPLLHIWTSWRTVYFNIFKGKYSLAQLFQRPDDDIIRIGLLANVRNSGNRNDGSYDYGDTPSITDKKSEDYKFKDTLRRIEKGVNLLYRGDKVSDKSAAVLNDFLSYAKSRNIYVIGFLPPYAQEIYDKMMSSGEYQYVFDLKEKLDPIFKNYNYALFDFSDMSSFGAEKDEIVDGLHASEKAYLKLFIGMVKKNQLLSEYAADLNFLEAMLTFN